MVDIGTLLFGVKKSGYNIFRDLSEITIVQSKGMWRTVSAIHSNEKRDIHIQIKSNGNMQQKSGLYKQFIINNIAPKYVQECISHFIGIMFQSV